MAEFAEAGGRPTKSDNLIVIPGIAVRAATPDQADLLIAAAAQIEGLQFHGEAVLRALPLCTPTSVRERLAALVGQFEVIAKSIEREAFDVQGCGDESEAA